MTTYAYFVRGDRHAAMCRTSIESVRKVDETAQIYVVTDDERRTWALDACICTIPSGMPIMLANLEAQLNALHLASPTEPIVFLDTDTLVLERPPSLGDLTITWRDHALGENEDKESDVATRMPYNYGVMVARYSMETVEAFIWMRERIRKMHSGHQAWYGNQLALAELAGPRPNEGIRVDQRRIPWMLTSPGNQLSIAKIPGEKWNWTPQKVGDAIHGRRSILHFKGGARVLMESYAKRLGLGWYEEQKAA